jgi:hypothetical protein
MSTELLDNHQANTTGEESPMKRSAGRIGASMMSVCLLFLTAASAQTADQASKKEVINQAHGAYYSLKAKGLAEFQCNLSPNWGALLADTRKTDPAGADRAISTLNQLKFTVSLGTSGSAKVTHTTVAAQNDEMAKGLNQIYGGMEQMLTGFFDTWSPFMVTNPFPDAASDYQLVAQGDQWQLSYKEGNADVVTTMGKDFAIRQLKVTTPDFNSTIQPQFTNSAQGFLLTGYQADYFGKTPSETTHLKVSIAYQEVNGVQLPQNLNLGGTYGGSAFQVEVAFFGCQATKK